MDINLIKIIRLNVVMAFSDLKNAIISRDQLYNILPEGNSNHFDLGEIILIKSPSMKTEIIVVMPENRVELNLSPQNESEGQRISKLARKLYGAIKKTELKAYGFNYFSIMDFSKSDARTFLLSKFNNSLEDISKQIESDPTSISVQLNYTKIKISHQLNLIPEASNGKILSINMNYHFAINKLPTELELSTQWNTCKEDFNQTIKKLFPE